MRLYILHRVHEIVYLCETIFRSFQIFTTTLQRTPAGSSTVDNVFCLDFVFGFYAVRLKQGECRPTDDTGEHFFYASQDHQGRCGLSYDFVGNADVGRRQRG